MTTEDSRDGFTAAMRRAVKDMRDIAASTPPADDVRDGVAKAMCAVEERAKASTLGGYVAGVQMWRRFTYEAERLIAELADRGLEVHPRGTIAEAKPVAWSFYRVDGSLKEVSTDRERAADAIALGADVRRLFEGVRS